MFGRMDRSDGPWVPRMVHVIRKWFDGGGQVTRSSCESTGGQVGVIGRSVRSWWEIVPKCNSSRLLEWYGSVGRSSGVCRMVR